uniref:Fatty acyl-CoA reductase n=1 Tax=Picea sitchensis TaxID=3332 RepID=A9NSE8_PICSI|nr:unknown [Picea sitchensis]
MGAELFKTLRGQHGDNFENFVFQKVVPVVGDVAGGHNLGIDKESTREHLWNILDAIVNNAASTMFDDRYDISLNVNTRGAENIVEFAKRCRKLQILLHVSTAYVVGRGSGRIKESPLKIGESMTAGNELEDENGPPLSLDIEAEFGLLENTLDKLHMDSSATGTTSTKSLQDKEAIKHLKVLGLERARRFGWPNTYSFTKAMGEMVVENRRENLPVVILRPTIIESTLAEPFPGWMEGTRTMDTFIVGYGKGRISFFLGDPELFLDVIPADMVVNQMMVAMATHGSYGYGSYGHTW